MVIFKEETVFANTNNKILGLNPPIGLSKKAHGKKGAKPNLH